MVDFNWGCGLNYLRTYLSDFVIQNCIGVNFMYFVNFMWKTLCLSINLVRIWWPSNSSWDFSSHRVGTFFPSKSTCIKHDSTKKKNTSCTLRVELTTLQDYRVWSLGTLFSLLPQISNLRPPTWFKTNSSPLINYSGGTVFCGFYYRFQTGFKKPKL